METFISFIVAGVFAVVFLAVFPAINTALRNFVMPVGILPIVGVEITLLPYILCAIAFFVIIRIAKGKFLQ